MDGIQSAGDDRYTYTEVFSFVLCLFIRGATQISTRLKSQNTKQQTEPEPEDHTMGEKQR